MIEIVGSEEKIAGFLPLPDGMIGSGLAITKSINVVRYGPREHG